MKLNLQELPVFILSTVWNVQRHAQASRVVAHCGFKHVCWLKSSSKDKDGTNNQVYQDLLNNWHPPFMIMEDDMMVAVENWMPELWYPEDADLLHLAGVDWGTKLEHCESPGWLRVKCLYGGVGLIFLSKKLCDTFAKELDKNKKLPCDVTLSRLNDQFKCYFRKHFMFYQSGPAWNKEVSYSKLKTAVANLGSPVEVTQ